MVRRLFMLLLLIAATASGAVFAGTLLFALYPFDGKIQRITMRGLDVVIVLSREGGYLTSESQTALLPAILCALCLVAAVVALKCSSEP